MRMRDEDHENDHEWIRQQRATQSAWREQWSRVVWAVITSVLIGAAISLFGVLGYAITVFVERGGQ